MTALLAVPFAASAVGLGSYNALVFNDFTSSNTDTEGTLAVGHDFNSSNYTVGVKHSGGGNSMIVGNNVNWPGYGSVNNGDLRYGGAGNFIDQYNPTVNGGTRIHDASIANFAAPLKTTYTNLSNYLGGLTTTASASIVYTLKGDGRYGVSLSSNATGTVVFNVDSSKLSIADGLTIAAGNATNIVVNVNGTASTFSNFGMTVNGNGGAGAGRNLLVNMPTTTSITYNNFGFYGSLLAPKATFNGTYGQFDGQLIANNFSGTTQINDYNFTGNLPAAPVPEPASIAALGLGAVAMLRRRKRSS